MANMDDLLSSLTDDDGIRPDFVEAVRNAHDEDMSVSITRNGELESQLSELNSASEDAAKNHAAEIAALKASFYDEIRSGNVTTEVDADVIDPDVDDDNIQPEPFYIED